MSGKDNERSGFTLIEVLVALAIVSIIMSTLYGVFSSASVNAKELEERGNRSALLSGTIDVLGLDVRGATLPAVGQGLSFSGAKDKMTFTTISPLVRDGESLVRVVTYSFEDGEMKRTDRLPEEASDPDAGSVLIDGVKDSSFSYYDGSSWKVEWAASGELPRGVKVSFVYAEKKVESVMNIMAGRR